MSKKVNIINNLIMFAITIGLFFMCPSINHKIYDGDRFVLVLFYVLGAILAGFVNAVFHELGHLIAGKKNGFEFNSMTIWFFKWTKVKGKNRFDFCLIGEEAGYTEMVPTSKENVGKRYAKMTEGGIIVSLILTIISIVPIALMNFLPIEAYAILSMFLPMATYYYLGNALPMSSEGVKNDGATARMLRKNTDEAKVMTNILSIQSELYNGKTPCEIDESLYFDLPQLPEDNLQFLSLLDARYAYYLDKEDYENAIKVSDRIEELLEYAPKYYRQPMLVNLLYNACVLTKDFDKADELMYEVDKYINSVNSAENVRVKLAYLVYVLEEKEDLDMFFDKAKREQSKMALKGLSKYEEKLVDKIKKDL